MTDGLLLHPQTRSATERICARPPHALLVVAPKGFGKRCVADHILARIFSLDPQKVGEYRYGTILAPEKEKTAIGIEQVRELIKTMKLKTIGRGELKRFAVIENADTMTVDAQNALLKLLEEPPEDTVIILTASDENKILLTVRSRSQMLRLARPDLNDAAAFFAHAFPDRSTAEIKRECSLSGGLPGLLCALLSHDTTHPLFSAVSMAKTLLGQSTFERLAAVDGLAKQKDELIDILFALQQIVSVALFRAAEQNKVTDLKRWHKIEHAVADAQAALTSSVQTKLMLTNLMLNL